MKGAYLLPIWSRIWCIPLVLISHNSFASHNATDATLWMQTSAEYHLLVQQVFKQAQSRLPELLASPSGTGALENQAEAAKKPPAVVLDVDETVLDNGPWEALEIVRSQTGFDPDSWNDWVMRHRADALPGALEYVLTGRRLGIEIFYVTNRWCDSSDSCPQQEASIKNLVDLGFPDVDDTRMLLRNERPEWPSDKSSRRAEIAKNYRIVQIVGDDLGDFIPGARKSSPQERLDLARQYQSRFGHTWYLIPNPRYGSWKRVLGASPESHLRPDREMLCLGALTPIGLLHGPGPSSFCAGLTVATQGVVTRVSFGEGGLGGYFIRDSGEEQGAETDQGIFVIDPSNQNQVEVGDQVEIRGKVVERDGLVALEPGKPEAVMQYRSSPAIPPAGKSP